MKPKTFLGVGWSFPPTFSKIQGTVKTVSDEEDVFQSLQILLSTELKERVMRSDFGCDLTSMLYDNITITLLTKIKGIITNAILKYEPRVNLLDVDFFNENNIDGMINIEITYSIRATNSRKNFVFPYYIKEGTFVK